MTLSDMLCHEHKRICGTFVSTRTGGFIVLCPSGWFIATFFLSVAGERFVVIAACAPAHHSRARKQAMIY